MIINEIDRGATGVLPAVAAADRGGSLAEIKQRLAAGYYDQDGVVEVVADRLLTEGIIAIDVATD